MYQWFTWQIWLPLHIAIALHSYIPCACCGSFAGAVVQNPQVCASGQYTRHCSATARVQICLAELLDDPDLGPKPAWNQ